MDSRRARVAVKPGYFTVPDDPTEPPRLLGSRCLDCGEHFFPRRAICAKCMSERTEDVLLGPRGRLFSYTFVHFPLFGSTRVQHVGSGVGPAAPPGGPAGPLPPPGHRGAYRIAPPPSPGSRPPACGPDPHP